MRSNLQIQRSELETGTAYLNFVQTREAEEMKGDVCLFHLAA
jgi:hypothetical protein